MNLIHESISISFRDQPVDRQYVEFQEHDVTLKYPCRADTNTCSPFKVKFKPGLYFIELWGASGGYSDSHPELGGYGSYTSGFLPLPSRTTFYFYLGQQGKYNGFPTFNGGGKGSLSQHGDSYSGSGGGSSDMRYTFGEWNDTNSLKSRIIVSAGGAGSANYYVLVQGGHAGGINGYAGSQYKGGETQLSITNSTGASNTQGGISSLRSDMSSNSIINGSFGLGANPISNQYGSGGGGGYYGGGGTPWAGSAGGGSSFISGYQGCDAIFENSTESHIYHSGNPFHYSGKYFTDGIMIDGQHEMPTTDMTSTELGHDGNGYAIITYISSNVICSCQMNIYLMKYFLISNYFIILS